MDLNDAKVVAGSWNIKAGISGTVVEANQTRSIVRSSTVARGFVLASSDGWILILMRCREAYTAVSRAFSPVPNPISKIRTGFFYTDR